MLPVFSSGSRSFHHAAARLASAPIRGSGIAAAATSRKSFPSTPRRLFQAKDQNRTDESEKAFTRYTFPKQIRIERASDMATDKPQRTRTAYIALGSNLGDRIAEIERACREMDARGIRVKRTSSLWETEPMYYADQDRFVNGACEVQSTFSTGNLRRCPISLHEIGRDDSGTT